MSQIMEPAVITVTDSLEVALKSKSVILAQGILNHGGGSSPSLGLVSKIMEHGGIDVTLLIRPEVEIIMVGATDPSLRTRTLSLCVEEIATYISVFPRLRGFVVDIPLLPTIDTFSVLTLDRSDVGVEDDVLFDGQYLSALKTAAGDKELWLNRSISLVPKKLLERTLRGLKNGGLSGILVPLMGGSENQAVRDCVQRVEVCRKIGLKAIVLPVRKANHVAMGMKEHCASGIEGVAIVQSGESHLYGALLPWNHWDVACNLIH